MQHSKFSKGIFLSERHEDETQMKNNHMSIQERSNLLFNNSEILAPMVRASSTPLRLLALSYGADLVSVNDLYEISGRKNR